MERKHYKHVQIVKLVTKEQDVNNNLEGNNNVDYIKVVNKNQRIKNEQEEINYYIKEINVKNLEVVLDLVYENV